MLLVKSQWPCEKVDSTCMPTKSTFLSWVIKLSLVLRHWSHCCTNTTNCWMSDTSNLVLCNLKCDHRWTEGGGWRKEYPHSLLKYPRFRKRLLKITIFHPDVMNLRMMLDALFDLTSDMYTGASRLRGLTKNLVWDFSLLLRSSRACGTYSTEGALSVSFLVYSLINETALLKK